MPGYELPTWSLFCDFLASGNWNVSAVLFFAVTSAVVAALGALAHRPALGAVRE